MGMSVGTAGRGGRGHRRRGRHHGLMSEINVTPFVDVMLVLLVIFMITAPILVSQLKINLPDVQAKESAVEDAKLVVSITKEEKIFISARAKKGEDVADKKEEDITDRLENYFIADERIQKEKELYIRADKEVKYGIVARVVAAARRAGVTNLNLMVQPELEDEAPKPKK